MHLWENNKAVSLSLRIRSCVLGFYRQEDKGFRPTAEVQYACTSLAALFWSAACPVVT